MIRSERMADNRDAQDGKWGGGTEIRSCKNIDGQT